MEYRRVPIEGFENYSIDTIGNIYSKYERLLKKGVNQYGKYFVVLSKKNTTKCFMVDILVARTFIGKPIGKCIAMHLDKDESNCSVENLIWMEKAEYLIKYRRNPHRRAVVLSNKGDKRVFESISEAYRFVMNDRKANCRSSGHIASKLRREFEYFYKGYTWKYLD